MWKRKGILILTLILALGISAFALEVPKIDQVGSISFSLKPGGSLTLYQVAEIALDDGDYGYIYLQEFDGFPIITEENIASEALAQDLWANAIKEAQPVNTCDIGKNGTVTAGDLVAGLYLVGQTENQTADGYLAIKPFLVSVPVQRQDGSWDYTVDAKPKTAEAGTVTPAPSTRPSKPSSGIPDTGQLHWPVPVLVISGLVIFALGWSLRFLGRKRSDEA